MSERFRYFPSRQFRQSHSAGALVLLGLLLSPAAAADWEEAWSRNGSVSGFGNLAYVYEGNETLGYIGNLNQKADADSSGSFVPDSRLGLQLSYRFDSSWSVTTQYVIEDRAGNEWVDGFKLGFVAYRPDDHWDLRLGRLGYDVFLNTDTRAVDFAHIWARPPMEIYGWVPLPSIDGGDITYHFTAFDLDWSLNGQYGSTQTSTDLLEGEEPLRFTGKHAMALSLTAAWENWKARLSYAQLESHSEVPGSMAQLGDQLAQIAATVPGPVGAEAAQMNHDLMVSGGNVRYLHAGLEYSDGLWYLLTELVRVETDRRILPNGHGGYLMAGRRIGQFIPYVIGARFTRDTEPAEVQTDWGQVSPELGALQLGTLSALNRTLIDQQTLSLGLRWDVTSQVSLKAQADWISITEDGLGLWARDLSDNGEARDVQLYTLALSFVF